MEMEQIHLKEEQQQEQQHEHKLQQQQHLQQQHLQQQQQQPGEATEQQQQQCQLSQKEVWHRKTSVMEIFRSSLGSDDDIIEEEGHFQDLVSSADPSARFPQTKSQSRTNVWGPVYLNRDTFIDMHIR